MPYIRTHGNQITIVHGERDKEAGKVQQRQLFTFYSKKEALAAIGEEGSSSEEYFQFLLREANPQLTFNWPDLKEEIKNRLDVLPDIYPVKAARTIDMLDSKVDEITKQLVMTDPRTEAGREAILTRRNDLTTLSKLIEMRMQQARAYADSSYNPFTMEDKFCWQYEIQRNEVPDDIEEFADDIYRAGDYAHAKPLFALLTRCFPNWAEGHNYMGLMALKEQKPKEAVEHFKNTVKFGRGLFPKRIAKNDYWMDISTRPYMRGLINLALAQNTAGQYRDALATCDKLEKECGTRKADSAYAHRAVAYLNLQEWQNALDAAMKIADSAPDEGFVSGFALFELGRQTEAVQWFLHAALNSPRSAYHLIGKSEAKPKSSREIEDHNAGLELAWAITRFFKLQSKQSDKFFKKLIEDEAVQALLNEAKLCAANHSARAYKGDSRTNLERWNELQELGFAQRAGKEISKGLGLDRSKNLGEGAEDLEIL